MTAGGSQAESDVPPGTVLRFDGAERAAHWWLAAVVGLLALTALLLSFDPLAAVVGRRALWRDVHTWAGLLSPLPLLVPLALPAAGRRLRADVRRLDRWSPSDRRWLRALGRPHPPARHGRFHPGQKLNAAFTAAWLPVMVVTGIGLRFPDPLPLWAREGVTFVHAWLALAIGLTAIGHVAKALRDPDAMRGMRVGWVPVAWARRRHPAWVDELAAGTRGRDAEGGAASQP